MSEKFDDLMDEVLKNARSDRQRLEGYVDQMGKSSINDPELAAALADSMVAVSEALTKNNAQFVEVLKVRQKRDEAGDNTEDFGSDETENMFEEIEEEAGHN